MRLSDTALLACRLLRDAGRAYGLELVKASGGRLKRGTVYVLLGRLADEGLVDSAQEIEENRPGLPKRYFWLTDEGRRAIDAEEAARNAWRAVMAGEVAAGA